MIGRRGGKGHLATALAAAILLISGCAAPTSTPATTAGSTTAPGPAGSSTAPPSADPTAPGPSASPEPTPSMAPATDAPATPPVDAATVAEARSLLDAADFTDRSSLDAIGSRLRFSAAGEWAAREVLGTSTDIGVLWAALWVYGSAGTDPAPLAPLLVHEDPSIRTMAAAVAVAFGDAAGVDVLEAARGDETQLLGSEPPISVGDFAALTLERWSQP